MAGKVFNDIFGQKTWRGERGDNGKWREDDIEHGGKITLYAPQSLFFLLKILLNIRLAIRWT